MLCTRLTVGPSVSLVDDIISFFFILTCDRCCLYVTLLSGVDNEIVCFLKVQLAEAINLQDKNQMAQIQETTRCVSRFDARTCRKLLAAIAEDYR